jgi:hypothetical protein
MRIKSGINIACENEADDSNSAVQCGKIILGPARGIRTELS